MNCIGVLFKEPVPGRVKTRLLSADFSAAAAAGLYAAFLRDTFNLVRTVDADCYGAVYAPPASPEFLAPFHDSDFWVLEQKGDNLGERMAHFFGESFARGMEQSVLIGSDSPGLPAPFLREALEALKTHEVVLGPALDGGYYLIGLSRPRPEIFSGVLWSSPVVLCQTLEKLREAGKLASTHLLPPWYDVDHKQDLDLLRRHLQNGRRLPENPFPHHTWETLSSVIARSAATKQSP